MFEPRVYRNRMDGGRFRSFVMTYRETDLWIGVSGGHALERLPGFVVEHVKFLREAIDSYGEQDDRFYSSMVPYEPEGAVPPLVERMFSHAQRACVGPMACVAGVFAREVGEALTHEFGVKECIVENGGDIHMDIAEPVTVSIFAGLSPLSNLAALEVDPSHSPLGICTSSGTVGHSFSHGCADAVSIACCDAGLADAFATAFANQVQEKADIDRVLEKTGKIPEILSALVIVDDRLGIRGDFPLSMVPS